jgi:hypothetical protein
MDVDPHQADMQVAYIQAACEKCSAFYLHCDDVF